MITLRGWRQRKKHFDTRARFAQLTTSSLTKEFDRFDCVTFMFEALKSLFNGQLDEHVDTTTNWIKRTIKRAIGGIVEPKEQDGTTLAEITIFFRCPHE